MKVCSYRCKKPLHREVFKAIEGIQAVDATFLYGADHIEFVALQADRAIERGEGICSNIFLETLVRASGQRQINRAIEMYGLRGSREIVVFAEALPQEIERLIGAEETELKMDASRIEALKEAFSISDEELEAVPDDPREAVKMLIRERIALVSVL